MNRRRRRAASWNARIPDGASCSATTSPRPARPGHPEPWSAVLAGPRTLTWTMAPQVLVDAYRDAKLIGKDETLRLVERASRVGDGWAVTIDLPAAGPRRSCGGAGFPAGSGCPAAVGNGHREGAATETETEGQDQTLACRAVDRLGEHERDRTADGVAVVAQHAVRGGDGCTVRGDTELRAQPVEDARAAGVHEEQGGFAG